MRLRRPVTSDLVGIFAIYDDEVLHGTSTFDEVPYSLEARRSWLLQHQSELYPALVVDSGENIVAFGSLSPWSNKLGYARAAELSIYVHKHSRREGLGAKLLHELIMHARAVGLGVLLSRVTSESQASIELHTEFGFRHVGTLHRNGKKFGRLLDVELFELELDPHA
jgi:L-amino acid N-acyltransferase YncA